MQAIHVARRAVLVFLCRPDPAEAAGDSPAMRIYRENLPAQRIHQNASRNFLADSRQRQQESFGILVAHLAQWLQSRFAELCHDDVEKIADRLRFLVRQSAADDRPRDIFGGRFGDVQVGGESFFQRAESAAVACFASLSAANDEQQLVQRVFEVVVVEVVVALFQHCRNLPDCRGIF